MNSTEESNFEWEQLQPQEIFASCAFLALTLFFGGNYLYSRLRVHLVLATSTCLICLSTFLYAFARDKCQVQGDWLVFLEGQLERISEEGGFLIYYLFVISRLSNFNSLLPGIRRWQRPLYFLSICSFGVLMLRQFFFDLATYNGNPSPSGYITQIAYAISMLFFFITNFVINYIIAKCFIKHALTSRGPKQELTFKCQRLLVLVYCSVAISTIGSIVYNINFGYDDLPLYHSMDTLSTICIAGHFYFEWLYQVLLSNIMASTNINSTNANDRILEAHP